MDSLQLSLLTWTPVSGTKRGTGDLCSPDLAIVAFLDLRLGVKVVDLVEIYNFSMET